MLIWDGFKVTRVYGDKLYKEIANLFWENLQNHTKILTKNDKNTSLKKQFRNSVKNMQYNVIFIKT